MEQLAANLLRHRQALAADRQRALSRVDELVGTQRQISQELSDGLASLRDQGTQLDALQAQEGGLLATLTRAFNRRAQVLQRRSAAEGLLRRYEAVSVALRRASAFTDELRLTALELQEGVDALHAELDEARRVSRTSARRVLEVEAALDALQTADAPVDLARQRDTLQFEERTESANAELHRARGRLCEQQLGPARALRDTIATLHSEMARFVVEATSSVNAAGRRIQALGLAADAPLVVSELRESMSDLDTAMRVTEAYIAQTQDLLNSVLPDLRDRLNAQDDVDSMLLTHDLESITRAHARVLADRALREAARQEVDALPGKTL